MVTARWLRGLPVGRARCTATAAGLKTATAVCPVAQVGSTMPWTRIPSGRQQVVTVGGAGDQVDAGDAGGERRSGFGQHGAGRSVLDDPTGIQHDDPVGQRQRVDQVVGDQQGGPAGVPQHLSQQLPQCRARPRRRARPSVRPAAAARDRRPALWRSRSVGPDRRTVGRVCGRRIRWRRPRRAIASPRLWRPADLRPCCAGRTRRSPPRSGAGTAAPAGRAAPPRGGADGTHTRVVDVDQDLCRPG